MDTAIPEPSAITQPPTTKRLTNAQRTAIVAEVASGKTNAQVAKDFNVHVNTVSILVNRIRKAVPQMNGPAQWRERVVLKSQDAIDAGVDCNDDPYKRGTLAVAVMRGLGEFAGDHQVNVFVNAVGSLPADLRSEYLSSDDAIEATAIGSDDLQVVADPSTIA